MKFYLDCGANTGEILLQQIPKYPGYHFVAFEPQPGMAAIITKKLQAYLEPITFRVYPQAVWTKTGKRKFYLAERRTGSTLITGMESPANIDYDYPVEVFTLDFPQWVKDCCSYAESVVMKMDIEGAEYEVLEALDRQGLIPLFKTIFVEFHKMMRGISDQRHHKLVMSLQQQTRLEPWH